MLAKILIFLASLIGVYIASKRHKIFAHVMSRVTENIKPDRTTAKSANPPEQNTEPDDTAQIEELDYDPETGRYSVRKNPQNRNG